MTRKVLILAGLVLINACSSMSEKEKLEKDIAGYKNEVNQIEQKIDELETRLKDKYGAVDENMIPVSVRVLKPQTFNHYIRVTGSTDAVKNAYISPEANGRINKIHVDEGDRVKEGELLVELNTSVTRNSIEEVKTSLELAKKMFEKQKKLWEQKIGSEVEYLRAKNNMESLEKRLETLQSQLEMSLIRAPYNGIVDEIFQKVGEMGTPGRQILRLVNLSNIRVEANVSEKYLPQINKGTKVVVNFPAYPEMAQTVPIIRTGNVINSGSRTFKIEVKVNNPDEKIKPNLTAEIKIKDFSRDSVLVVPSVVVKEDMTGNYVYVVREKDGQNIAKKVYVTTGNSYNNKTMIKEGLQFGDKLIVAGYSLVSDELLVSVKKKSN